MVEDTLRKLLEQRKLVINCEATLDELKERVHQGKITFPPGTNERDMWPLRNKVLQSHVAGIATDVAYELEGQVRSASQEEFPLNGESF